MSQHSDLLLATSELRSDLERTIEKMKILESENRKFRLDKNELELLLSDCQGNYNNAKKSYLITLNKKINQEEQFEGFIAKVKQQLREKSKEFETLREKFAPSDIDFVRIKVQEEMEIKYTEKIQHLEAEVEENRNQNSMTLRELNKCKTEYECFSENQKNEVFYIRDEYEKIIQQLREEISNHQNRENFSEKDESIRKLKLQVTEMTSLTKSLREESKKCRDERDYAITEREIAVSANEEIKNQYKSKFALSDSTRFKMELSNKTLQAEVESKESQLTKLKRDYDLLLTTSAENERRERYMEQNFKEKMDHSTKDLGDSNTFLQNENQKLITEINRLHDVLASQEEHVRRTQKMASDLQMDTEKVESNLRKTFQIEYQKLLTYNSELEISMGNKENELRSVKKQLAKINQQVGIEMDLMKNDIQRLKREKAAVQDKLAHVELNKNMSVSQQ